MPPESSSLRRLVLPPKGRPHLLPSRAAHFDLGYLSWGRRWYGKVPIKPSLHEGWHYFLVTAGRPSLLVGGRERAATPGILTISHPDCPVGHRDVPGRACRMLTWIWRTPPTHSMLRPKRGNYLQLRLTLQHMRRVAALHQHCRRAVARADERSLLQLRATRLQLDLELLDASEARPRAAARYQLELAIEFLRNHLELVDPVAALANYLQLPDTSLKRFFRERTGQSPRAFALDWRMRWARAQLRRRENSVQSIAARLGYAHANDFSRAYRRHFGRPARRRA